MLSEYSEDNSRISKILELWLSSEANPNLIDNHGMSPLSLAITNREIMAINFATKWNERIEEHSKNSQKNTLNLMKFDFQGKGLSSEPLYMACEIPSLNMINDIGHELYFSPGDNQEQSKVILFDDSMKMNFSKVD
jgi:hypothetical protein